jgi:hypothetical protein
VTPDTIKPVVVNKSDGSTTIALKKTQPAGQQRLDQNYIDKTLGPGYQAGKKDTNLALLARARKSNQS